MPRSFLVKTHSSHRVPNYRQLETQREINGPCSACRGLAVPLPDKAASSTPAGPPGPWGHASVITRLSLSLAHHEEVPRTPGPDPLQVRPLHLWAGQAPSMPLKDTLNQLNLPPLLALPTRWPPIPGPAGDHAADGRPGPPRAPGGLQCAHCGQPSHTPAGPAGLRELQCQPQTQRCFSCKHCDKEYGSLGALKMHLRTHTLPCPCAICGKAFSRPWLLQGHIRTHTGEKPYTCPHCSRAFADRSNLRAHLQTHSQTKKYPCKNCAKTFSRMSLLARHEESGCCRGP